MTARDALMAYMARGSDEDQAVLAALLDDLRADAIREAADTITAYVDKARRRAPGRSDGSTGALGARELILKLVGPERKAGAPADFFQPGYTYARHDGTTFRCDAITTHPTSGWRLALGWHTDTADWTFLAHQGVDPWNHDYDQNGERR